MLFNKPKTILFFSALLLGLLIFSGRAYASGTLSVTRSGAGAAVDAKVLSNDGFINCPATSCSHSYASSPTVTLNAYNDYYSPAAIFTGWGGAAASCGTNPTCAITMTANKSVTANFTEITLDVSLSNNVNGNYDIVGSGVVSSDKIWFPGDPGLQPTIYCQGATACSSPYNFNSYVRLFATPAQGSFFAGWSGDVPDTCANFLICDLTMDDAKNVTATFGLFQLQVNKDGPGSVTVPSPDASCGADCYVYYPDPNIRTVTLNAGPAGGHILAGWVGDVPASCATNPAPTSCTVTINSNKSVTAYFRPIVKIVTVTKIGDGQGTVTSSATKVFWDNDLGVQAAPVDSPINCGTICSGAYLASYPLNADTGRIVTFQDPSEQYVYVTLTAAPASGEAFGGWGGDCAFRGLQLTCNLPIDGNHSVTARFEPGFLHIVNYGGGLVTDTDLFSPTLLGATLGSIGTIGGISCGADCDEAYSKFSTVTLTAAPVSPNLISRWTGCSISDTDPNTCTVVILDYNEVKVWFAAPPSFVNLTMKKSPEGNVVGPQINCGADCYATFPAGNTKRDYDATPVAGYGFSGWGGDTALCGANSKCTLVVDPAGNGTLTYTGAPLADVAEANFAQLGCSVVKNITASFNTPDGPTCILTASPAGFNPGQAITLTWTTTKNPTSGVIDDGVDSVPATPPTGGTLTIMPSGNKVYSLTVSNNSGNGICTAAVQINTPPPAPAPITPPGFIKRFREILPF